MFSTIHHHAGLAPGNDEIGPLQGKTVLFVQPRRVVLTALDCALRDHGYSVIEAADANDALDHARRGTRIDVVLVEFAGREISGPELVRSLRRLLPTVRTIFMGSSRCDPQEEALGTVSLAVPFGVSEVLTALRTVFRDPSS
jgi:DNA-binding response OmpR family regulator